MTSWHEQLGLYLCKHQFITSLHALAALALLVAKPHAPSIHKSNQHTNVIQSCICACLVYAGMEAARDATGGPVNQRSRLTQQSDGMEGLDEGPAQLRFTHDSRLAEVGSYEFDRVCV